MMLSRFISQGAEFFQKNERRMILTAFLVGFVVDSVTLTRIDLWYTNLVLFSYLLIAVFGVLVINIAQGGVIGRNIAYRLLSFAVLATPFAFGGLLSGYFVFYTRSASLASSWVFVALLALLIVGNEVFRNKYERIEFQVSALFAALFFFAIFYVPIVMHTLGVWVFVLSGVVSLILISVFLFILARLVPAVFAETKKQIIASVGIIFCVINILYFTNIIPPIPLSLKTAGVYYSAGRTDDGTYRVSTEPRAWYDIASWYHRIIYHTKGESLYFLSAVFAPTKLNTTIFHEWQYFDESSREWVTTDRLSFSVVGGRDGGYRGYSMKQNITMGEWRVNVVTERGQVVGRTRFTVKERVVPLELVVQTVK